MAARLFQSILLEVKDNVDFILGVVDNTGVITACTELKFIGESIEAAVEFFKMGLEEGREQVGVHGCGTGLEEWECDWSAADQTGAPGYHGTGS